MTCEHLRNLDNLFFWSGLQISKAFRIHGRISFTEQNHLLVVPGFGCGSELRWEGEFFPHDQSGDFAPVGCAQVIQPSEEIPDPKKALDYHCPDCGVLVKSHDGLRSHKLFCDQINKSTVAMVT